jgi:hypothetical protein
MSGGLLLLWNDVDERRRSEYDCWHTIEHVPERVWVPGYRCASRHGRLSGAGAEYFTRYELDDLDCLKSPAYQELVDRPTPWSASMRPSLCSFVRRTYDLLADTGPTLGSTTWVRRAVFTAPGAPKLDAARAAALAAELLARGEPACLTRAAIGHQRPSGPQAIANVDTAPAGDEYVFLLDIAGHAGSADAAALSALFDRAAAPALPRPDWQADAMYGLLSSVRHVDVQCPARPPPRNDLASHFARIRNGLDG